MRPLIGIVPLYDTEKQSYWMLPGYMQALEACLAVPVMLPLTQDPNELRYFIRECDGLLFPGGLLAVIVPETFLGEETKKIEAKRIYQQYNHVVQVKLDPNAFAWLGVRN